MTRSTPDPVFTEAGRAALLAEVRAEQQALTRSRARRRRLGVRELLIGTAVVAAAATILVVVHTAPRPSADPAQRPTASASPPVTTAPTPTPTASATAPLIGPTGSRLRTEAEIRSWAATAHIGAVSTEQDVILVRCMAAKGFLYDPIRQLRGDLRAGHNGMTSTDEARWDLAYSGTAASGSYTWQTAGCDGLAVHETGQDGAH